MPPQFRIVPTTPAKVASVQDTSNALGVHDSLTYGPRTIAAEISQSSVRERLENWEETQDNLKLSMQRNIYGLHAPMRSLMERKIVADAPHLPTMPYSNLHLDILMGRDETIEPADIFLGMESSTSLDVRREIEKKHL